MSPKRLKLLIVEDSAVDRAIWKNFLAKSQDWIFECEEEEDGEAGLRRAGEFHPDCILLDHKLPDMSGIEFLNKLHLEPRCAVVVATAYGSEDIAVRSMKTGATDYLVKGAITAPEILEHTLVSAVERIELQRTVEQHRIDLERRNTELEQSQVLAAGIAHDFKYLLESVVGSVSLALDRLPDGEAARPLLGGALDAARRAADLARQLLAYGGKSDLTLRTIDLPNVVRSACGIVEPAISGNVRLSVRGEAGILVRADPVQIQQIVWNLVTNAAEAIGPQVSGTIDVRCAIEERPAESDSHHGKFAVLEVADSGRGMDDATRARIFDGSFTTKSKGRGFGLVTVQGIVRAHSGEIEVSSQPGAGTTFRVLIPTAGLEMDVAAAKTAERGLSAAGGE